MKFHVDFTSIFRNPLRNVESVACCPVSERLYLEVYLSLAFLLIEKRMQVSSSLTPSPDIHRPTHLSTI